MLGITKNPRKRAHKKYKTIILVMSRWFHEKETITSKEENEKKRKKFPIFDGDGLY